MKWHNLRVGLTCLATTFLVLLPFDCFINYKFGDWAAGFVVPVGVFSAVIAIVGLVHLVGWTLDTWEGPKL